MSHIDTSFPSAQMAVLGFLVPGPKHGYELYHEFSEELGKVWLLGRSKLYAELKDAENQGRVTVETQLQPNRPPRKVYHLTAAGQAAFLDWVQQPTSQIRSLRIELLARVFFYDRLQLAGWDEFVARQREVLMTRVRSLTARVSGTESSFGQSVLRFRCGQLEAVINWLDCCVQR